MIALYLYLSSSENTVIITDESISIGRTKMDDLLDIRSMLTQKEVFYGASHLINGPTPNGFIREERVVELCLLL